LEQNEQRWGNWLKKLFVMGVETAKKKRELAARGQSDFMTNFKFKVADKIVFKKSENAWVAD